MLTTHQKQSSIKDYWGFSAEQMAQLMEIKNQSYKNKSCGFRPFTNKNIDKLKENLLSKIEFYLSL